jgi:hypothetical protein
MNAASLTAVFDRRRRRKLVSPSKLRARLRAGGALEAIPVHLPGTRLRALHYLSEAALIGYFASGTSSARRQAFARLLDRVPGLTANILRSVPREARHAYPDALARMLARAVASAIHLGLATRYRAPGRGKATARALVAADRRCRAVERDYRRLLAAIQQRTVQGDGDGLRAALEEIGRLLSRNLAPLAVTVARLASSTVPGAQRLTVRFAGLARRFAMLGAALVMLDWRLRQDGPAETATRRAARTRRQLARDLPSPAQWRAQVIRPRSGQRVVLIGRVRRVAFYLRGQKPYSDVILTTGLTLRVPYKNVGRLGWRRDTSVWVRGKVKRAKGGVLVEVSRQGPGTRDHVVWEDWLAVTARPAYDLYPETLDADWSLAAAGGRNPLGDVLSRTALRGG